MPQYPLQKLAQEQQLNLPFKMDKHQCSHEKCQNWVYREPNGGFSPDNIDWNTKNYLCNSHSKRCEACNHYFDENTLSKTNDYNFICPADYAKEYTKCQKCKDVVHKESILDKPNKWDKNKIKHGCSECSGLCESCEGLFDKDDLHSSPDKEIFCGDCYSEHWASCDQCGTEVEQDDIVYHENSQTAYCPDCYSSKFPNCEACGEEIDTSDDDEYIEYDKDFWHKTCANEGMPNIHNISHEYTDFNYNKQLKNLHKIYKILPISVKELKTKYPHFAQTVKDLITFSKGKTLTKDLVDSYQLTLENERFPVNYSAWTKTLQRSVKKGVPQLVININASESLLNKIKALPAGEILFNAYNEYSESQGHPHHEKQIGWARLELDPNKEYILVDEIQTDHSGKSILDDKESFIENDPVYTLMFNRIKGDITREEISPMSDEEINVLIFDTVQKYNTLIKDFPSIATEAITQFARKNKFKKIYWHTYAGGMTLKNNQPPHSLYEEVPKAHGFEPAANNPFDIDKSISFWEREAQKHLAQIQKIARYYSIKKFLAR